MIRRLTATCPRCQNRFQVEAEVDEAADAGYACRCPRCQTDFPVPCGEGVPQPRPTPWAVHATPKPTGDAPPG